jgi:hypothetical protein
MTGSARSGCSASSWLRTLVLGLAASTVLLSAGTAAAQALVGEGDPINLLPQADPNANTGTATDTGTPDRTATPEGIQIETLEEVSGEFSGPLTPQNGGLQPTLWRGSSRGKIERLFARLPLPRTPGMASLSRIVLLTNGNAPPGQGTGVNILALRARILADMGNLEDALELLRSAPAKALDPAASRMLVELAWQNQDIDGACTRLLEPAAAFNFTTELQQERIFCQWRVGQQADAQLGRDLLREQGVDDPAFNAIMDRMAGDSSVEIPAPRALTPPLIAMLQAVKAPLPANAFDVASTDAVAVLARDSSVDPVLRLSAAEAAASQGALSAEVVREVYAAQKIDPQQLATASELPETGASAQDRAVLYQAVAAATPEARASILQVALGPTGWADNDTWRLQVFGPFLLDLPPSAELSWYAPEAAHYLFALGEFDRARAWIALTQGDQNLGEGSVDTNAAMMLPSLLALDFLAGGYQSVPVMGSFRAQAQVNASPDSVERLEAIFAVFDESALAGATPDGASAPASPQTNRNLWLDLGYAAEQNMQGEAALLALIGLNDLATAEPLWLQRALGGLRLVGLEDQARRIAVEAAIANGL